MGGGNSRDNDNGSDCTVRSVAGSNTNNNATNSNPSNANIKAGGNKALLRYQNDVNLYQKEIEDLKDQLANEPDPCKARQISKMLLETQHVLTDVLIKMEKYK